MSELTRQLLTPYIGTELTFELLELDKEHKFKKITLDGITYSSYNWASIKYMLNSLNYTEVVNLSGSEEVYLKPKFRKLSNIVNAVTIDGRTFLPLKELEMRFWQQIPSDYQKSLKAWIFHLIREGKVHDAPYRMVRALCEWHFWIHDPKFFDEGLILEIKD